MFTVEHRARHVLEVFGYVLECGRVHSPLQLQAHLPRLLVRLAADIVPGQIRKMVLSSLYFDVKLSMV
jgi:hypothetical protein